MDTSQKPVRVIPYTRVSTLSQVESGAGLAAQRTAIAREIEYRGWNVVHAASDEGMSGKSLDSRPGLVEALAMLDRGEADALVVAKLDRLSRSIIDGAQIMDRARRNGWALVCLDLGVDTATASGEMFAGIVLTMSQYERRLIGDRTRVALAAKKAAGVRLGRPRTLPDAILSRIVEARRAGGSFGAIARDLNNDQVPTSQGGAQWWPATVKKVVESQDAILL